MTQVQEHIRLTKEQLFDLIQDGPMSLDTLAARLVERDEEDRLRYLKLAAWTLVDEQRAVFNQDSELEMSPNQGT